MDIYLNGVYITTINISYNGSVYFQNAQAVQDEKRGYLMYINGWCFVSEPQYLFLRQKKDLNKLALVLESPHVDEYSSHFVPLRPANGKTGIKLNKKITDRPFINNLNQNTDYEVYLMNPIQYQCSCHYHLTNNGYKTLISSDLTKKVFRALFNEKKGNLKQDFVNRLKTYSPDVIVNSCTSSLKTSVIKTTIQKAFAIPNYYEDIHPSMW